LVGGAGAGGVVGAARAAPAGGAEGDDEG
jgi:hypothetical protein